MDTREATPADASTLEAYVDGDLDAERLIRERTVVVAEANDEMLGFVAYDAWNGTVHVSALVGDSDVVDVLLQPARRLAATDDMPVEIVVPDDDHDLQTVVEEAGFERVGTGPLFDGEPSHRYRYNES